MSDHTEAEIKALDDFTKEIIDKFVQEVIDLQLCGPCVSIQVLTSMISTMVVNGFLSPDMVMNIAVNAIHIALNPDTSDDSHVDRGTIYASQVH